MDNKNFQQDEKPAKEKAMEIIPAIVAGIFLLLGMYFTGTLKIVFCTIAGVIAVGAYLVVLVREIINRRRKKKQ